MSYNDWKAEVLARPGAEQRVRDLTDHIQTAQDLAALRRAKGLTQRDAAELLQVSQPRIAQIEKAENLTTELIHKYAHILGGQVRVVVEPSSTSSKLPGGPISPATSQSAHRVTPAEIRRSGFPLTVALKRGWIQSEGDDQGAAVLQFLQPLREQPLALAARKADNSIEFTPLQEAWVARILQLADGIAVAPYNPEALAALAERLRSYEPADLAKVPAELSACGVIALMEEHLPGSKLDGIAVLRGDGAAIIAVTNRGKRFDTLLWTILHEVAHVWLGHLHAVTITIDEDLGSTDRSDREIQADSRAKAWLFPTPFHTPTAASSVDDIHRLSRQYDVHPSVIVGQILRCDSAFYKRLSAFLAPVPMNVWQG